MIRRQIYFTPKSSSDTFEKVRLQDCPLTPPVLQTGELEGQEASTQVRD